MSLNESIVEHAALEWFRLRQGYCGPVLLRQAYCGLVGKLGFAVGYGPHSPRTLATLRDTLLPKLLSGELSVAGQPCSGT